MQPIKNKAKILKSSINSALALAGYSALTLLYQNPVVRHFTTHLAGSGDVWQMVWNLWWVKKALLELHHSPFFCEYLFYPRGTHLVFYPMTLANSLPGIPLQAAFGIVPAFNILYLSTFMLAGWGAYLLIKQLTGNGAAAFLAGLIFAFAPKRSYSLWSLDVMSSQYLPFLALYLVKARDTGRWKHWLMAGGFLWVCGMASWYYLLMGMLFWIMWALIHAAFAPRSLLNKRQLARMAAGSGLFLILTIPFVLPALREKMTGAKYMTLGNPQDYSCDLASLLLPGGYHPLFGNVTRPLLQRFKTQFAERVNTLGFAAILLAIIGLITTPRAQSRPWWTVGLIFLLLSLGPVLQIMGEPYPRVPMLYRWFAKLPFVSVMRSPTRMTIMTMLSLSVLAGYGLDSLLAAAERRQWRKLWRITILITAGGSLLAESFALCPTLLTTTHVIPAFLRNLRQDSGDFGILEIPLLSRKNQQPMYFQTIHEKKLASGYLARLNPADYSLFFVGKLMREIALTKVRSKIEAVVPRMGNPYVKIGPLSSIAEASKAGADQRAQLPAPAEPLPTSEAREDEERTLKKLQEVNIRYVILYTTLLSSGDESKYVAVFERLVGNACYRDAAITVFRVPSE